MGEPVIGIHDGCSYLHTCTYNPTMKSICEGLAADIMSEATIGRYNYSISFLLIRCSLYCLRHSACINTYILICQKIAAYKIAIRLVRAQLNICI